MGSYSYLGEANLAALGEFLAASKGAEQRMIEVRDARISIAPQTPKRAAPRRADRSGRPRTS